MHLSQAAVQYLENEIPRLTEGFTGADLQALLYTAKLNALKEGAATDAERKGKNVLRLARSAKPFALSNFALEVFVYTEAAPALARKHSKSFAMSKTYPSFNLIMDAF